ncbi:MAG: hypothetical protein FD189_1003 [Elusimicrobia bacterium]|nr:MAG: hypothetical protein FD154_1244 [Elusimicrobiota bacterium]KAF0156450.1 MAG: hypothetical protein FD189_1003 [Elusimicrobiota bacterium]
MRKKRSLGLELSARGSLEATLRAARMMAAGEDEFLALERAVEEDPLFKKLVRPPGGASPAVRRRRPGGVNFAWNRALGQDMLVEPGEVPAGGMLEGREAALALIKRIGAGNFERYFLSDEPVPAGRSASGTDSGESRPDPSAEAAAACGLAPAEFAEVRAFTASFLAAHERLQLKPVDRPFAAVAAVAAGPRGPELSYLSSRYARGTYDVDLAALRGLGASGLISSDEKRRLRPLLAALRSLNSKKRGLTLLLPALAERQADFLLGRIPSPRPLSMTALAADLGLSAGSVSRLAAGRSLLLPSGEEITIRSLFPGKGSRSIDRIRDILIQKGGDKLTDDEVAARLRGKYGLKLSRRTVNHYRGRI